MSVHTQEAARPWFNNRNALDESASHPERHSDKVGKYLKANRTKSPVSAGAAPAPSSAEGKKQPLPVELMGSESAQYVTVPKRPKVARRGLDLSSWG